MRMARCGEEGWRRGGEGEGAAARHGEDERRAADGAAQWCYGTVRVCARNGEVHAYIRSSAARRATRVSRRRALCMQARVLQRAAIALVGTAVMRGTWWLEGELNLRSTTSTACSGREESREQCRVVW